MSSVSFHSSPIPETVLGPPPEEAKRLLAEALARPEAERRSAVSDVVAQWPHYLEGWARLGQLGRDTMERYAAFRVGYHRGLDQLRQSGWRGSGFVRWSHQTNQGFLLALAGLAHQANVIGESDEAERCQTFIRQLDPDWNPPSFEA